MSSNLLYKAISNYMNSEQDIFNDESIYIYGNNNYTNINKINIQLKAEFIAKEHTYDKHLLKTNLRSYLVPEIIIDKIIDGKEEEVYVPTKARSLKKKYLVEWFDMFEKDFDDCDRGGFCAAHASLDGKRKLPKESDWFWKWYEEELLWR